MSIQTFYWSILPGNFIFESSGARNALAIRQSTIQKLCYSQKQWNERLIDVIHRCKNTINFDEEKKSKKLMKIAATQEIVDIIISLSEFSKRTAPDSVGRLLGIKVSIDESVPHGVIIIKCDDQIRNVVVLDLPGGTKSSYDGF